MQQRYLSKETKLKTFSYSEHFTTTDSPWNNIWRVAFKNGKDAREKVLDVFKTGAQREVIREGFQEASTIPVTSYFIILLLTL